MRIRSAGTSAALAALSFGIMSTAQNAAAMPRAESLGAADQSATAHFNVYLPLTHTDELDRLLQSQTDTASPNYHQWLTPAQFKQQFGPSRSDVAKARSLLQAAGFTVVAERTQNLVVEGPVSAVERMFETQIERVSVKGHTKLSAANHRLNLPQSLAAMGAVIPEFKTNLMSHVHSKLLRPLAAPNALSIGSGGSAAPSARLASADSFFYANDLNEAYQLPSFRTEVTPLFSRKPLQIAGVGAHIGIVISSVINPADLAKSFDSKLSAGPDSDVQAYMANSNLPVPTVTIRPVAGGSGPFTPTGPTEEDAAEASLDTQMSLGTAPGATETLYDMPDLSNDSVTEAYALVDEDNAVDVVSSSFGQCELDFTAAYNNGTDFTSIVKTWHALFQQGNAQGITFLASSGDNGAVPCFSKALANAPGVLQGTDFVPGVESPEDDPNVTSVGGTNLQVVASPGPNDSTYLSENADFDPRLPAPISFAGENATVGNNTWGSGGGFSQIFSKPLYQFLVNTGSNTHRAVPDVSLMMGGCPGDADLAAQDCTQLPRSAVIVWFNGVPSLLIGTSSSSPEMAGVLALAVELNRGRLGNVNPLIYALSAVQTIAGGIRAPKALQFFHRNISGDNNGFTVKPGQAFSEVLGNGTLDVKNFLQLQGAAPAGTPSTPSNP
ncbi:MAG TPA: S53 family serine peptidase [Steroidobacteraceae bacterium]|nr:S53 family serine peptidase [Steroidobacteraceae bacterium]